MTKSTFFFPKWLCRSILEHCCDKLETMRCASQNHAVSKKNGIQHGFGTSEEFKDGVSQVCFLFVLGRCGVLSFLQRFFEALACRKQTWASNIDIERTFSVACNMCARATQQLRSISHVCTCKERHHPKGVASHMCAHARNVITPTPPPHPTTPTRKSSRRTRGLKGHMWCSCVFGSYILNYWIYSL